MTKDGRETIVLSESREILVQKLNPAEEIGVLTGPPLEAESGIVDFIALFQIKAVEALSAAKQPVTDDILALDILVGAVREVPFEFFVAFQENFHGLGVLQHIGHSRLVFLFGQLLIQEIVPPVPKTDAAETVLAALAVVAVFAIDHDFTVVDLEAVETVADVHAVVTELAVIGDAHVDAVLAADGPVREVAAFTEVRSHVQITVLIPHTVIPIDGIIDIRVVEIWTRHHLLQLRELLEEGAIEIECSPKRQGIPTTTIPPHRLIVRGDLGLPILGVKGNNALSRLVATAVVQSPFIAESKTSLPTTGRTIARWARKVHLLEEELFLLADGEGLLAGLAGHKNYDRDESLLIQPCIFLC